MPEETLRCKNNFQQQMSNKDEKKSDSRNLVKQLKEVEIARVLRRIKREIAKEDITLQNLEQYLHNLQKLFDDDGSNLSETIQEEVQELSEAIEALIKKRVENGELREYKSKGAPPTPSPVVESRQSSLLDEVDASLQQEAAYFWGIEPRGTDEKLAFPPAKVTIKDLKEEKVYVSDPALQDELPPTELHDFVAAYLADDPEVILGLLGSQKTVNEYYQQRLDRLEKIVSADDWSELKKEEKNAKLQKLLPDETPLHELADKWQEIEKNPNEFLLNAAQVGDIWLLKLALKKGANINQADNASYTPLMRASFYGQTGAVKVLLDVPEINVNQQDDDGATALMYASYPGHTDVVKVLLDVPGIGINHKDKTGYTALMFASDDGHTDVVKVLLGASGININQTHNNGYTALMFASCRGHIDIVKVLLDVRGIDINHKNIYGATALKFAFCYGHADIVKAFVGASGIIIDYITLESAVSFSQNSTEVTKVLLAAVKFKNTEITRVLALAKRGKYDKIVGLLESHLCARKKLTPFIINIGLFKESGKKRSSRPGSSSELSEFLKKSLWTEERIKGEEVIRIKLFGNSSIDQNKMLKIFGNLLSDSYFYFPSKTARTAEIESKPGVSGEKVFVIKGIKSVELQELMQHFVSDNSSNQLHTHAREAVSFPTSR